MGRGRDQPDGKEGRWGYGQRAMALPNYGKNGDLWGAAVFKKDETRKVEVKKKKNQLGDHYSNQKKSAKEAPWEKPDRNNNWKEQNIPEQWWFVEWGSRDPRSGTLVQGENERRQGEWRGVQDKRSVCSETQVRQMGMCVCPLLQINRKLCCCNMNITFL